MPLDLQQKTKAEGKEHLYLYYRIGDLELPRSVFSPRGGLVECIRPAAAKKTRSQQNGDKGPAKAYLRLFDTRDAKRHLRKIVQDDVAPPPRVEVQFEDVVMWIPSLAVGDAADVDSTLNIYWAPTSVQNWNNTGFDAEFLWEPTAEPISGIPKKELQTHLQWIEPLVSTLQKYLSKQKGVRRTSENAKSANGFYAEYWNWENPEEEPYDGHEYDGVEFIKPETWMLASAQPVDQHKQPQVAEPSGHGGAHEPSASNMKRKAQDSDTNASRSCVQKTLNHRALMLRHGQSQANVQGVIVSLPATGCNASGLTEKGKAEAKAAARKLEQDLAPGDRVRIHSSDFLRALETATTVAAALSLSDIDVTIHLTQKLRERFFGEYEGGSTASYQLVWDADAHQEPCQHRVESVQSVRKRALEAVREADEAANLEEEIEQRRSDVEKSGNDDAESHSGSAAEMDRRTVLLFVSHGDTLQILQTAFEGTEPWRHRGLPPLGNAELRELSTKSRAVT
ncbi:hypothetical protein HDU89_003005 [Geranomyces variabilis]|nr:hypothetical protein HDU89_003005 [Geranomyces variabilis]